MAFRSNSPVMVALPSFRGVTRRIVLAAVITFFALLVLGLFSRELAGLLGGLFALQSERALRGLIWEFVTYPFVTTGIFSILFASMTVWFFGSALEEELGSRWMAELFFICTIGGGLLACLLALALGRYVEGFGPGNLASSLWPFSLALLLVFARLHPDQELNFNFILRLKAKYLAALYLLVYLAVMLAQSQRFETAVVLCNALCGWLYLRFAPRRGIGFAGTEGLYGLRNAWYRAKRRRAAKKFTVYMQKQGRDVRFDDRGRYIDPDAERKDPNDRRWMN